MMESLTNEIYDAARKIIDEVTAAFLCHFNSNLIVTVTFFFHI